MNVQEVDKDLYSKNLKIVIVTFVASFALLAIGFGSILIHFFGITDSINAVANLDDSANSNFKLNLLGVILALAFCAAILHSIRHKPFFVEVYYVWQIKQIHNLIYRKLKKIKKLGENNDHDAIVILNVYFFTIKQVYQLDNNTLTIDKVNADIAYWRERADKLNLQIDNKKIDVKLIKSM